MHADSYGFEISAQWKLSCRWRVQAWYAYLKIDADINPQSNQTAADFEDIDPRNQAFLISSWDLGCGRELDLIARYVDTLRALSVPSYISLDLRYSMKLRCGLEATVVGQNLLDSHHPQYGTNQEKILRNIEKRGPVNFLPQVLVFGIGDGVH